VADRYLTLKDMTSGGGCTPRTVRYYERQGLLRADRSAGGHRLFAVSELERLNFVIALREAGWALEEIVELLGARDAAANDQSAVGRLDALLQLHIDALEKKLAVLGRLREDLRATHSALRVCQVCTTEHEAVSCETCVKLPELVELPRGFRVTWRGSELSGPLFDDGADELASALPE